MRAPWSETPVWRSDQVQLERVTLHRFGCFWHETLDLAAGATLLIGSNDSGKSTLIEAIRALFVDADRFGTPFNRSRVMSRPASRAPGAWQRPPASDAYGEETDTNKNAGAEDDANLGEVAWVLGEFGDLNEDQQRQWAPVITDGVLRFGALFASTPERSGRCLVIDEDSAVGTRLAEVLDAARDGFDWTDEGADGGERPPDEDGGVDFTKVLMEQVLGDRDGGIWLNRLAVPLLLLTDLWPEPRPPLPLLLDRHHLVTIPGPDAPAPSVDRLLRDLAVESALDTLSRMPNEGGRSMEPADGAPGATALDSISDLLAPLLTATDDALRRVEKRYAAALDQYLGARGRLTRWERDPLTERVFGPDEGLDRVRRVLEAAVGEVGVEIERGPTPGGDGAGNIERSPLGRLGAGAQRRALLAVLDVLRDATIWRADRFTLLLIEEPEVGLDPSAQRRVAKALKELPTYHIQTVVVSHSPIMIGASHPDGWRLVRADLGPVRGHERWRQHHVASATELQAVAQELGAKASDVLLARRFVVVEGKSDVQAFDLWARTLRSSLEAHGVQLVPAHGHAVAPLVGRLLELAYPGVPVAVVLDGGQATEQTARKLRKQYGERVPVTSLRHAEIEAYYSPTAVASWLMLAAKLETAEARAIAAEFEKKRSKSHLHTLANRYLRRDFDVVNDGRTIIKLMRGREIPSEIEGLIAEWVRD